MPTVKVVNGEGSGVTEPLLELILVFFKRSTKNISFHKRAEGFFFRLRYEFLVDDDFLK